jgi:hypothetical protein
VVVKKKKSEMTPEEYATHREKANAYDRQYRKRPDRQAYMKDYLARYTKTAAYREWDNGRYTPERQAQMLINMRKRLYGMTPEMFAALVVLQGGVCAICKRPLEGNTCIDHDHATNENRGLLCRVCNTIEGFIRGRGMTPEEYAKNLSVYLADPPVQQLLRRFYSEK